MVKLNEQRCLKILEEHRLSRKVMVLSVYGKFFWLHYVFSFTVFIKNLYLKQSFVQRTMQLLRTLVLLHEISKSLDYIMVFILFRTYRVLFNMKSLGIEGVSTVYPASSLFVFGTSLITYPLPDRVVLVLWKVE